MLQRWRESGSAAPKPRGGSISPLEEHMARVLAVVAEQHPVTVILNAYAKSARWYAARRSMSFGVLFFEAAGVEFIDENGGGPQPPQGTSTHFRASRMDAPVLCDDPRSPTPSADECPLKPRDGQPRLQPRKPGNGQRRHDRHGERPSTLEPEQSAALQGKLLTALGNITSADGAATWAQEVLAAKNRLVGTDAKLVEDALSRTVRNRGSRRRRCSQELRLKLLAPMRHARKKTATLISPTASTFSPLGHRGAIVTASIFAMLPNRRVWSAAANNPIHIISATCSRERSAAK